MVILEDLLEIVFGVTGMLILRLLGKPDHSRSDTKCILVGLAFWVGLLVTVGAVVSLFVMPNGESSVQNNPQDPFANVTRTDSAKIKIARRDPDDGLPGSTRQAREDLARVRAASLAKIIARIEKKRDVKTTTGRFVLGEKDQTIDRATMTFLKEAVAEVRPLLRECYQNELRRNPELMGYVQARISIVADDEYGGLVETSEIIGGGPIAQLEAMTECLRETMYTLRFEPRKTTGRMVVTYSLIFSSTNGERSNIPEVPDEAKKLILELENWSVSPD